MSFPATTEMQHVILPPLERNSQRYELLLCVCCGKQCVVISCHILKASLLSVGCPMADYVRNHGDGSADGCPDRGGGQSGG